MKKILSTRMVVFIIAVFSFISFQTICFSEDKSVTVTGRAEITGKNLEMAKHKALAEAFRQAVESGLGVWIKSETDVKDATVVRDEILSRAEGYVTEHDVVKEGEKDGQYFVTIRAKVAVDKIGADFKKLVGRVKTAMGNPSITFVLTTWQKIGAKGSYSEADSVDVSAKQRVKSDVEAGYDETLESEGKYSADVKGRKSAKASKAAVKSAESGSYKVKGSSDTSGSVDTSAKVRKEGGYEKIDERLWKKYPDPTIIDAFQQEFKEKRFDLKATDKAREIALTESLAGTSINLFDRAKIREQAEKEGANFVARGEAKILDIGLSENTGNYDARAQIGVEIIDVNSGDVVGAYSNSAIASSKSEEDAKIQAIKKIAILAARTLADQTITTWQERTLSGRQYTIEIRNIKSKRKQQRPFLDAIGSVAQITGQTEPSQGVLLINVLYEGDKNTLGKGIMSAVESKFSEEDLDDPSYSEGKIIFTFKK